jgi:hypothetical protein
MLATVTFLFVSFTSFAQQGEDKSKRPSPLAFVKETIASGTTISLEYSQPSVKGRTIGKDLEPMAGQVWRTGANEATIFETSKAVKINGQELPAGKYSLFSIAGDEEWTIIFNKKWKQWGAYSYKQGDDALRIKVQPAKTEAFAEKLTFFIDKKGAVNLFWGNINVGFNVE